MINHPAPGANIIVHHAWHGDVEIKTDGKGNFFARVCGCLLGRTSEAELRNAIDRKLAANTPQEDA